LHYFIVVTELRTDPAQTIIPMLTTSLNRMMREAERHGLSLIDPDEGCFSDNVSACFLLYLAAGGFCAERQMVDRKGKQTKVITMTSMTVGRAGTAVAHATKVINGLLESRRAAGTFDEPCLVSINVVGGPMVPFACGCVRIVTKEEEAAGRRRRGFPIKGGGEFLSIARETARDR
jgi:hypothetical protein